MHSFHWADYLVLAVVLTGSLLTGVFFACHGGKQRTTGEYFQGNRRVSLIPTALSIMVSYISGQSKVVFNISVQSLMISYISGQSIMLSYISMIRSVHYSLLYFRLVHHGLIYVKLVHHGLM